MNHSQNVHRVMDCEFSFRSCHYETVPFLGIWNILIMRSFSVSFSSVAAAVHSLLCLQNITPKVSAIIFQVRSALKRCCIRMCLNVRQTIGSWVSAWTIWQRTTVGTILWDTKTVLVIIQFRAGSFLWIEASKDDPQYTPLPLFTHLLHEYCSQSSRYTAGSTT